MITTCMNGDIDMIITKAISRVARNTLDTLRYVRMLKEGNIAVSFEEENINTLTMDGELLLVVAIPAEFVDDKSQIKLKSLGWNFKILTE